MALVQISKRKGSVDRVPAGQTPLVELELEDNQEIVRFELHESLMASRERKTTDYWWEAWVATRL